MASPLIQSTAVGIEMGSSDKQFNTQMTEKSDGESVSPA